MGKATMVKAWRIGWWPALVLIALGALLIVRNVGAGTRLELPAGWPEEGPKYICLGSVAVRLGDDDAPAGFAELFERDNFTFREAQAARRCRVAVVPSLEGAELVASLAWPQSGYAAVVQRVPGPGRKAMTRFRAEMEHWRWVETGGSRLAVQENPKFAGAAHEREGAWIHTVAVDDLGSDGVWLVTSGQFAPEYFFK